MDKYIEKYILSICRSFRKTHKKIKETAIDEFNKCTKLNSEKKCLSFVSDKLLDLTNGYKLSESEVQALVLVDKFYNKIDDLNETSAETEHIFLSLIDLVSHNVTLFAEDAWSEEYIDYFNEKHDFSEYYKISSVDFRILYSFYRLLYMIDEQSEI